MLPIPDANVVAGLVINANRLCVPEERGCPDRASHQCRGFALDLQRENLLDAESSKEWV